MQQRHARHRHHRRISAIVEQTIRNHHPNRRITIGQRPEQHRLTRRGRPEERRHLRVILSKKLLNTALLGEKDRISHCHLLERSGSTYLASTPARAEGLAAGALAPCRTGGTHVTLRHKTPTSVHQEYLRAGLRQLPPAQTPAVIR